MKKKITLEHKRMQDDLRAFDQGVEARESLDDDWYGIQSKKPTTRQRVDVAISDFSRLPALDMAELREWVEDEDLLPHIKDPAARAGELARLNSAYNLVHHGDHTRALDVLEGAREPKFLLDTLKEEYLNPNEANSLDGILAAHVESTEQALALGLVSEVEVWASEHGDFTEAEQALLDETSFTKDKPIVRQLDEVVAKAAEIDRARALTVKMKPIDDEFALQSGLIPRPDGGYEDFYGNVVDPGWDVKPDLDKAVESLDKPSLTERIDSSFQRPDHAGAVALDEEPGEILGPTQDEVDASWNQAMRSADEAFTRQEKESKS